MKMLYPKSRETIKEKLRREVFDFASQWFRYTVILKANPNIIDSEYWRFEKERFSIKVFIHTGSPALINKKEKEEVLNEVYNLTKKSLMIQSIYSIKKELSHEIKKPHSTVEKLITAQDRRDFLEAVRKAFNDEIYCLYNFKVGKQRIK